MTACDDCLRRTDLIAALAGRIEVEWRLRTGRPMLLALADERLLDWAGDAAVAAHYAGFARGTATAALDAASVVAVCRCDAAYPAGLHDLPDPPAVLHILGDPQLLDGRAAIGIVGSRRCSPYGDEVARSFGRGFAAAGIVVVSGMALGVDCAAHEGALETGPTVAVLATGADRPYPARKRELHRRIATTGCVVSEMPPGFAPHRWGFPARNRIIAALSAGTVVVEGTERSGSLITADFAAELGRFVAAVPGRVTCAQAAGPHLLLKSGAELVREPADALDLLALEHRREESPVAVIGRGPRPAIAVRPGPAPPDLPPRLGSLLADIENGATTVAALTSPARTPADLLAALGELELRGLVRRRFGGSYERALS